MVVVPLFDIRLPAFGRLIINQRRMRATQRRIARRENATQASPCVHRRDVGRAARNCIEILKHLTKHFTTIFAPGTKGLIILSSLLACFSIGSNPLR